MANDISSSPLRPAFYDLGQLAGLNGKTDVKETADTSAGQAEGGSGPAPDALRETKRTALFSVKAQYSETMSDADLKSMQAAVETILSTPALGDIANMVARLAIKQMGQQQRSTMQQQLEAGQAARNQSLAAAGTLEKEGHEMKINAAVSLAIGLASSLAQGLGSAAGAAKQAKGAVKELGAIKGIAQEKQALAHLGSNKVGTTAPKGGLKQEQAAAKVEATTVNRTRSDAISKGSGNAHELPADLEPPQPTTRPRSDAVSKGDGEAWDVTSDFEPKPQTRERSNAVSEESGQARDVASELEPKPQTRERSNAVSEESGQARDVASELEPKPQTRERSNAFSHGSKAEEPAPAMTSQQEYLAIKGRIAEHKVTLKEAEQLSVSGTHITDRSKLGAEALSTMSHFVSSNNEADMKTMEADAKRDEALGQQMDTQAELAKNVQQGMVQTMNQIIEFVKDLMDSKADQMRAITRG